MKKITDGFESYISDRIPAPDMSPKICSPALVPRFLKDKQSNSRSFWRLDPGVLARKIWRTKAEDTGLSPCYPQPHLEWWPSLRTLQGQGVTSEDRATT